MSDSLRSHGLHHARLPCPSPSPGVCSDACPLSWWCCLTISSSATPFSSCLQSFLASGSFPVNWLFTSDAQSIGTSASALVLPVIIQSWFPLRLTGLISLQSKGLLRIISQFESINSSGPTLLYSPTLTSVYDYWKNHSFDYTNFCQQSDVFAF